MSESGYRFLNLSQCLSLVFHDYRRGHDFSLTVFCVHSVDELVPFFVQYRGDLIQEIYFKDFLTVK